MKKVKKIEWKDGNYGFIYGYIDRHGTGQGVQIFSIGWHEKGQYKLGCEYFKLKEQVSLNEDRELLKSIAQVALNNWIESFYE